MNKILLKIGFRYTTNATRPTAIRWLSGALSGGLRLLKPSRKGLNTPLMKNVCSYSTGKITGWFCCILHAAISNPAGKWLRIDTMIIISKTALG